MPQNTADIDTCLRYVFVFMDIFIPQSFTIKIGYLGAANTDFNSFLIIRHNFKILANWSIIIDSGCTLGLVGHYKRFYCLDGSMIFK